MDNEQNNKPDLLDNLLRVSPEELLRTLPNDMRNPLATLLGSLDILEEKPLSEEEHDEMLKLILRYFKARDAMNNSNSQPCG